MVEFIPYDEVSHKQEYLDMLYEYCMWLDNQVLQYYGVHLFQGDIREAVDRFALRFASIKPSDGIILMMKVDGRMAGMARLDRFRESIGMVHNVYINPEYRGRGYSTLMMDALEERARGFGFTHIRLDTGGFNKVARSLYGKLGYVEIERFIDFDNLEKPLTRQYYLEKVYMEKKL